MILGSSINFNSHFSDFDFSIQGKIFREKRALAENTFKKLTQEYVRSGGTDCRLADVKDSLIAKGIETSLLGYESNDFTEKLIARLDNIEYTLSRALFPKHKTTRSITFKTLDNELHRNLAGDATADSLADFLIAVHKWIPEYQAVEEKITEEEERRILACRVALDLLERRIKVILEEKGYDFHISHESNKNIAKIRIDMNNGIRMNIDVDLMEDFLERLTQVVESMPERM